MKLIKINVFEFEGPGAPPFVAKEEFREEILDITAIESFRKVKGYMLEVYLILYMRSGRKLVAFEPMEWLLSIYHSSNPRNGVYVYAFNIEEFNKDLFDENNYRAEQQASEKL